MIWYQKQTDDRKRFFLLWNLKGIGLALEMILSTSFQPLYGKTFIFLQYLRRFEEESVAKRTQNDIMKMKFSAQITIVSFKEIKNRE